MAKFLFIIPPFVGHTNPTLGIAEALKQQGHQCAWLGYEGFLRHLLPQSSDIVPLSKTDWADLQPLIKKLGKDRGLKSILFGYENFWIPWSHRVLPEMEMRVKEYQPDVLVVEQFTLAGMVVARRLQKPWVSLVVTTASILKIWEKMDDHIVSTLVQFQQDVGLKPIPIVERPDLSPYGVIVCSTPELVGDYEYFEAPYTFVGPTTIGVQRPSLPFPWERLRTDCPRVLISLGTVNSDDYSSDFYTVMMEALAPLPIQVIMVVPEELELANSAPANFIIRPHVPQLELFPQIDAIICHAGHGTVCEALAYSIPLVVMPMRYDQPVTAHQVTQAGVGLSLSFGRRTSSDEIRKTIQRILDEKSFREAAVKIRDSFEKAGGAKKAAEMLEGLLSTEP